MGFHLVVGDEEFLVERAISDIIAAVKKSAETGHSVGGSDAIPITSLRAGQVSPYELIDVLSPSLFAEERIVVLRALHDAGKDPAAIVADTVTDVPDGVTLIIEHSGGGRTASMVTKLKKNADSVTMAPRIVKPSDRAAFVTKEFARHKVRASADVVNLIIDSVGTNLRELAAAASQLSADTGGQVDINAVKTYYSGRADVTGFDVADKTVTGDTAAALESLRWALHQGVPLVLLADALADSLHGIARVRGIGPRDQFSMASELGMNPYRVKKLQAQARAWNTARLSEAIQRAATLNGDVKGLATHPEYAVEDAVRAIAELAHA